MFRKFKKKYPIPYAIVIGFSIIMFWRGLWGLMDMYVFPENKLLSYTTTAIAGLLLLYLNDFKLKELE